MTDKVPAKERALNADRIARIGREVRGVLPVFDADAFTADVMADLPHLELKDRITRTAKGLHDHLPLRGAQALDVLRRALPATPQAAGITNDFGLHLYSPHSAYVARYCRTEQDLEPALDALRCFTRYFSAEDATRYFLNDFPEQTMQAVSAWARDGDYRVRRLASEATRPTLPWSIRITQRPGTALAILDRLHTDPSRFVTQSVANHLRDIAATDPELVLATLTRWRSAQQSTTKELDFITREALKTALKQGWPPAYELLGFPTDATVHVSAIQMDRDHFTDGDELHFTAQLDSDITMPVHVMYVINSTTPRGTTREKVYFLTRTQTQAGQPLALDKRHHLRSTATSKITPGRYHLGIQVNGRRFPTTIFLVA